MSVIRRVVYDGEKSERCPGSGRRGQFGGGVSSADGESAWVTCPECHASIPHSRGLAAASIPPHMKPRALGKRPSWTRVSP